MKRIIKLMLAFSLLSGCMPDDDLSPGEIKVNNQYMKSVYLGKVAGSYGYAYKVTIDSADYILVKTGNGVTMVRHK